MTVLEQLETKMLNRHWFEASVDGEEEDWEVKIVWGVLNVMIRAARCIPRTAIVAAEADFCIC